MEVSTPRVTRDVTGSGGPAPSSHQFSGAVDKRQFLESGRAGLVAGKSGPSTREAQLAAEVAELTQALGEAADELRRWKKSAEGRLGPSRTSR